MTLKYQNTEKEVSVNQISHSRAKMVKVPWIQFSKQLLIWTVLSMLFISKCNGLSVLSTIGPESDVSHETLSRYRRDGFKTLKEYMIPTNYSIHEPPPPDPDSEDGSTEVELYILIVGIRNIQEVTEEVQVELNLQIYWRDIRLSHLSEQSGNKFVVLNPVLINDIWHPDIYIDHVKKIELPKLLSTPASLRIYPDSTIRYSGRMTLTMSCNFDFHFFPADTQRCPIEFKSYAYSERILRLDWREHKEAAIKNNLVLPNFIVGLGNTQNFTVKTSSGAYSAISCTIILRRLISFHMIQTYLPSGIFIIVSWLSFLVSPESIPGRMTLCITTLLTITAMFASVRQNIPNVSYIKALDIWMITCIIFVFFTLVEFTIILKLRSIKKPKKPEEDKTPLLMTSESTSQNHQKYSNGLTNRYVLVGSKQMRDKSSNTPIWVNLDSGISATGDSYSSSPMTTTEGQHNGCCDLRMRHSVAQTDDPYALSCGNSNNPNPSQVPPVVSLNPVPPASSSSTASTECPHEDLVERIEFIMSKLIPISFVIFNCIYWPWLIISADYFNEEEFDNTNYAP